MIQPLTPKALFEWLQNEQTKPILLDVREPWEFDLCHINGAKRMPMSILPSQIATLDENADIVVLCHHGIRSQHAALFLAQCGFRHLYNLEGGIDQWAKEIDPTLPLY